MSKLAHEVTEEGVRVVLRPSIGAPSSLRVSEDEAIRFARAVLDDLGVGDGLGAGGRSIQIGRLLVDTGQSVTKVGEHFVRLTAHEFRLLEALALRPGQTLAKEQLLSHIYAGRADEPEAKIIDVFVCKVRHKLRLYEADGQLETVWGRGYRLVAEPTQGPAGRTYQPAGVQAAILDRLGQGPATFLDLWNARPECQQGTIRNAIQALRQRGWLLSDGDPRGATYHLAQKAAA